MAGFFEIMMGGGEPPTPEQRKAMQLAELKHRAHHERQVKDALPVIQEIRKNIRELSRQGFNDGRVDKARRDFATLADDPQTWLESPPPAQDDPCNQ